MSTVPAISVLMPVFNGVSYLSEAIESVLNQTFTNFELIIIDDCSTDTSVELIKKYTDSRIQLIEKPVNTGLIASLNMALKLAKGEYIARMDADDVCLPHRFATQYNYLQTYTNVLVLGSNYSIIDAPNIKPNVPITANEVKLFALTNSPVAHPSVMMRATIFSKYQLSYDATQLHAEDYDLWTRILEIGTIENLPEVLLNYRIHNLQVSQMQNTQQLQCANSIRLRQLQQLVNLNELVVSTDFALLFLTKKSTTITSTELKQLKQLLAQLYAANITKHIYNNELFYKFLQDIWYTYAYRITAYKIKDITLLLPNNNGAMCTMGIVFNTNFILKSFF